MKLHFSLILCILLSKVFGQLNTLLEEKDKLTYNCPKEINHCQSCHKGFFYIVCDQCDNGYGVNTKHSASDTCEYCPSVIDHCIECKNPIAAWSCTQCEDGYKIQINPGKDDICVKISYEEK
jgi:hypothetical protein